MPTPWDRPRRRSGAGGSRRDLRRSRRDTLRTRAATSRGLVLSLFLSMPVGGAFVTGMQPQDPAALGECRSLSSALGQDDQRVLQEQRRANLLSPAQRKALNLKVCDATLLGMIPHLANLVSDGSALEEVALRISGIEDEVTTMNLLQALASTRGAVQLR